MKKITKNLHKMQKRLSWGEVSGKAHFLLNSPCSEIQRGVQPAAQVIGRNINDTKSVFISPSFLET